MSHLKQFWLGYAAAGLLTGGLIFSFLPQPAYPAAFAQSDADDPLPAPAVHWHKIHPDKCCTLDHVAAGAVMKLGGMALHEISAEAEGTVSSFFRPGVPVRYLVLWREGQDFQCADAFRVSYPG